MHPGRDQLLRYALVAGVPLAVWIAFLPGVYARAEVFTWDSAAYIDCARSILAGRGFMQRVIDGFGPEIWQPISWWPPGYPLLIAAVASLGIDVPSAGVIVAVASAAAAVLLLGGIALRLFDWRIALPFTVGIAVMPPFLQISVTCMSDASYLALAVANALLLIRWSQGKRSGFWPLVLAGVLAGWSWGVRNVALATLFASTCFILAHALWDDRRRVAGAFAAWGVGAAAGLTPFVARNLVTFGALNGYAMPPSELTLGENIRTTAAVMVYDFTGSDQLAGWAGQPVLLLAAVAIGVLIAAWWFITRSPAERRKFAEEHRVPLFFVVWAAVHLAIVIVARSTYRWGEEIGSRHTMQTYWLLWLSLGAGSLVLLSLAGLKRTTASVVVASCFALLAARQAQLGFQHLRQVEPGTSVAVATHFGRNLTEVLQREVGPHQIVLAHGPHLLRTHCDINARKIPTVDQYYKLGKLTGDDLRRHGDNGFLWGLVIADHEAVQRGMNDELIRDIVNRPAAYPEFERIPIEGPAIVLKYVRPRQRTHAEDTL